MDDTTYAVTLVRVGSGGPVFEIGAYTYTGRWLPSVGETISIRRASSVNGPANGEAPEELRGYVTKVNPTSKSPISVLGVETDPSDPGSTADYLVEPAGGYDTPAWQRAESF